MSYGHFKISFTWNQCQVLFILREKNQSYKKKAEYPREVRDVFSPTFRTLRGTESDVFVKKLMRSSLFMTGADINCKLKVRNFFRHSIIFFLQTQSFHCGGRGNYVFKNIGKYK